MSKTWNVLRADSLPSGEQLQELEAEGWMDGWMVVSIVPDGGAFFIYLRRIS